MPVEDLESYGVRWMAEDDIEAFLAERAVGVLCLEGDGRPVVRPMSYALSSPSRLYFLFVRTRDSLKEAAADRSPDAQFLVYDAHARYEWTSVHLSGEIEAVPPGERAAIEDDIELGWRPEAFEAASHPRNTRLYAFEAADRTGLTQEGPPPGYEPQL